MRRSPPITSWRRLPRTSRSPSAWAANLGSLNGTCFNSTASPWPAPCGRSRHKPRLPLAPMLPLAPTVAESCWMSSCSKSNSTVPCRLFRVCSNRRSWPWRTPRKPLTIGCCRLPRTSNCISALPCCHTRLGSAKRARKRRPSPRLASRNCNSGELGSRGIRPARSTLLLAPAARRAKFSFNRPFARATRPCSRAMGVVPRRPFCKPRSMARAGLLPPRR